MSIDTVIIPTARQVIYGIYGDFPSGGLSVGDLAWATDRKCLYRWSGSAWQSIGISSRNGDLADIGDAADYPESSLYQADDTDELYMVVSGAWDKIVTPAGVIENKATDDLKNSNDTERMVNSVTSYAKIKEIKFNEAFDGHMRIKFDMKGQQVGTNNYGRIYKNGSPVGTEQHYVGSDYSTLSEDLELSLAANDLLQIYSKTDEAHDHYVCNWRLYYNGIITEIAGFTLITELLCVLAAVSTTNQDP